MDLFHTRSEVGNLGSINKNVRRVHAVMLIVSLLTACTLGRPATERDEDLVPADAAVFDRQFEGLAVEDLDLDKFWNEKPGPRVPVPLNNLTFAEVAEGARQGVVNI